jgi:hypothetical protein
MIRNQKRHGETGERQSSGAVVLRRCWIDERDRRHLGAENVSLATL